MKGIRKCLLFPVLGAILFSIGCGSKSDEYYYVSYNNTMVKSFALVDDESVLPNLDKIFFTIDLDKALIYNADSLPYGTDISGIAIMATFNSASSVMVYYESGGTTQRYNYLYDATTKIDFTESENGGVRMSVVAADGYTTRDYLIKVNVHKVAADSLYWQKLETNALPASTAGSASAKCIKIDDRYCLFYENAAGEPKMVSSTDMNTWSNEIGISAPESTDWRSLVLVENTLFVSRNGVLYSCNDFSTFTFTESPFLDPDNLLITSIIGAFNNKLLAVVTDSDATFSHIAIDISDGSYTTSVLPDNFPTSGFSSPVILSSQWGSPQLVIACGTLKSGKLTNAIWGFDGNSWAILNNLDSGGSGAPITPRTGATLFPYYTSVYDEEYDLHKTTLTYFLFGGWDGTRMTKDLFYTTNLGGTWSEAGEGSPMQLPEEITARMDADAFVLYGENGGGANPAGWEPAGITDIPDILKARMTDAPASVPYVYMVGGSNSNDYSFLNEIWKGVILRFTFPTLE